MRTVLEVIKAMDPCESFEDYVRWGVLNEESTVESILTNGKICNSDLEWLVAKLLGSTYYVQLWANGKVGLETFNPEDYRSYDSIDILLPWLQQRMEQLQDLDYEDYELKITRYYDSELNRFAICA